MPKIFSAGHVYFLFQETEEKGSATSMVPLNTAIGNRELMHEGYSKYSRMGTAIMK